MALILSVFLKNAYRVCNENIKSVIMIGKKIFKDVLKMYSMFQSKLKNLNILWKYFLFSNISK